MATKQKKWVRFEMTSPLSFDRFDIAASLFGSGRVHISLTNIPEKYNPNLNFNIDISCVKSIPISDEGEGSIQHFSFEGATIEGYDSVRGEFDLIRQVGWIEAFWNPL